MCQRRKARELQLLLDNKNLSGIDSGQMIQAGSSSQRCKRDMHLLLITLLVSYNFQPDKQSLSKLLLGKCRTVSRLNLLGTMLLVMMKNLSLHRSSNLINTKYTKSNLKLNSYLEDIFLELKK